MSISVSIDGLTLNDIVWRSESLWLPSLQYIHHTIKGANNGPVYIQGKDNATATLEGRLTRTAEHEQLLADMIGKTATVTGRGTHTAVVLSITDNNTQNPAWVYFTVALMELA